MPLLLVALAAILLERDCAAVLVYPVDHAAKCDLSACPCFRFPVGCVQGRCQCCNVCSPCDGDPGDGLDYLSSGGDAGPDPCMRGDGSCRRDGKVPVGA